MTKEINIPNKIPNKNERTDDLDLDDTFSMGYLCLRLILQLDKKISDIQSAIAICKNNISICDLDIREWNSHMQKEKAIKDEVSALCQQFLTITDGRKLGHYFPKTSLEIEIKNRFVRPEDKFRLLPGDYPFPDVLEENTIYLQVNLEKGVLVCKLYNHQNKVVTADVALNGLWCIGKNCAANSWHQALTELFLEKSDELRINLLENLAKKECIPDPYAKKWQLFQKRIVELEGSIRETQSLINAKETIKKENMAQKEKYEAEVAATQQQLIAIQELLQPNLPHQNSAGQPWVGVALKKQDYQLQVIPMPALSNLFARRRGGHDERDERQSDADNKYVFRQFRKS